MRLCVWGTGNWLVSRGENSWQRERLATEYQSFGLTYRISVAFS
jgi:hypothetical protein